MRWRNSCGRMSPTRWVLAFVWPFAWHSKQVTPRLGRTLRRSSVWLNCCCGNGVTEQPQALELFRVQDSVEQFIKVVDGHELALRHVTEIGPCREVHGGRKLRQKMVRQVEVQVEAREIAALLLSESPRCGTSGTASRLRGGSDAAAERTRPETSPSRGFPQGSWPEAFPRSFPEEV